MSLSCATYAIAAAYLGSFPALSLLEGRGGGVLWRKHDLAHRLRADPDRPGSSGFTPCSISGAHRAWSSSDGGVIGERHEAVPETLGNVDRLPGLIVQPHLLPPPEGRGTDPERFMTGTPQTISVAQADHVLRLA